jgi:4-diphosphocytidyl-2C-methyl-D-erythritol kinase
MTSRIVAQGRRRRVLMSGSGPTVFGVFPDSDAMRHAEFRSVVEDCAVKAEKDISVKGFCWGVAKR